MQIKVVRKKKAEASPKNVQSNRSLKKEAIERNIVAAVKAFDKLQTKSSQ